MNNEIKEILDNLADSIFNTDWTKLLDYITNLQDYKSRCEKAIEYINLTGYGTDFSMNAEEVDVLFNILKGE